MNLNNNHTETILGINLTMRRTVSIKRALDYCVQQHDGLYRKGEMGGCKLPYIFHPFAVAELVWELGAGTPDNMIAALGHDLLEENSNLCFEDLEENLGTDPSKIIFELSFFPSKEFTKADYINSFVNKSIEAVIIKIADRIHNTKSFFIQSGYDYAPKYFHKCDSLFELFNKRKEEVVARYGEKCFENISNLINFNNDMLKGK